MPTYIPEEDLPTISLTDARSIASEWINEQRSDRVFVYRAILAALEQYWTPEGVQGFKTKYDSNLVGGIKVGRKELGKLMIRALT
jgi:hypothetical protein